MTTTTSPRFQDQSLLEHMAVSMPVAQDYLNRTTLFMQASNLPNLREVEDQRLDALLSTYLNNMFKDGADVSDGNKTFAAILDARPGSSSMGTLPRSRRCLPRKDETTNSFFNGALVALKLLETNLPEACLLVLLMFSAYLWEALVHPTRAVRCHALNLHPLDR